MNYTKYCTKLRSDHTGHRQCPHLHNATFTYASSNAAVNTTTLLVFFVIYKWNFYRIYKFYLPVYKSYSVYSSRTFLTNLAHPVLKFLISPASSGAICSWILEYESNLTVQYADHIVRKHDLANFERQIKFGTFNFLTQITWKLTSSCNPWCTFCNPFWSFQFVVAY